MNWRHICKVCVSSKLERVHNISNRDWAIALDVRTASLLMNKTILPIMGNKQNQSKSTKEIIYLFHLKHEKKIF